MGLDEAIEAERLRPKCRVHRIIEIMEGMDKADRLVLEKALMDVNVRVPWIVRALKKQGIVISESALRNYRETHNVA